MKAIFTVGVSASGKSTWANNQTGYIVIDNDDIRRSILHNKNAGYVANHDNMWRLWDFKWEHLVSNVKNSLIDKCITDGKNIILCETNLGLKYCTNTTELSQHLMHNGYDVEFKYFPITFNEAITRDRARVDQVGDHVISMQWNKWISLPSEITGIRKYIRNETLPKCIIVDIDGTVAKHEGRSPYDWSKVKYDEPILEIINLVQMYYDSGFKIVFVTGRSEVCREDTTTWLKEHVVPQFELSMREDNTYEKDRVIKERIFFNEYANRYSVELAIDDRRQMVNLWTDIGVKLLNVGNCYDEF